MGHVLADSEEEESEPGLTLQTTMAQESGLQPALLLDEMLDMATEELDERLDQMLLIQECDTVPDEFLEAPAETHVSRPQKSLAIEKADPVPVDEAHPATVDPVTVGDSVAIDPVTVGVADPVMAGDLCCVSFTEVRGKPANRHEKLMRIQEVKSWDRSDGVMVLIHDALKLGKSASFSDFAGWIVLDGRDELFVDEDGESKQFLPADTCRYQVLSAKPFETVMPTLRKQSAQMAHFEDQIEAQEADAARARHFAPTVDYLKAVPIEQAEKTSRLSASGDGDSASGAHGRASGTRCSDISTRDSASGVGSSCSGARGSSDPSWLPPTRPAQWCGEGPLPIYHLESQARHLFEEWKIKTLANNFYLHAIPVERENEALNDLRRKIWLKSGLSISAR